MESLDLFDFVESGDAESLRVALQRPEVDVNFRRKGSSKEHHPFAPASTSTEIVDLGDRRDDEDDEGDEAWLTPLHIAVKNNAVACVHLLLFHDKIDVNAEDEAGCTPLHLAVNVSAEACVKLLLHHSKIDVNAVNKSGFTPLHIAVNVNILAVADNVACAKLLLDHPKIDVNARNIANNGFTPLHLAIEVNAKTNATLLLDHPKIDVNAVDKARVTPLHLAVKVNAKASVRFLLDHPKIDVNAEDKEKVTPLHLAVKVNAEASVRLLLDHPKIDVNAVDRAGVTPLHKAVEVNAFTCVWLLFDHPKIDVSAVDKESQTALDKVIVRGKKMIFRRWAEVCMSEGAKEDEVLKGFSKVLQRHRDKSPEKEFVLDTLLMIAEREIEFSRTTNPLPGSLVRIGVGLRPEAKSKNDARIMNYIASAGINQLTDVAMLVIYKDINGKDRDGQTPIHFAVEYGHTKVVKALVSNQSLEGNEENEAGQTPLQIAMKTGRKDIEKVLRALPDVKDFLDRSYRDRQVHVDAANAILVGAALIASVTFAGWLQPPLGYTPYYDLINPDPAAPPGTVESYAGVQQHKSIRVYWVFNSLSFFFATATVIAGGASVLPTEDMFIGDEVRLVRRSLMVTSVFLVLSVVFVLGAFGAAGFASLPPIKYLEMHMIVTTVIGGLACAVVVGWFLVRLYKIRSSWLLHSSKGKFDESTGKPLGVRHSDVLEMRLLTEELSKWSASFAPPSRSTPMHLAAALASDEESDEALDEEKRLRDIRRARILKPTDEKMRLITLADD